MATFDMSKSLYGYNLFSALNLFNWPVDPRLGPVGVVTGSSSSGFNNVYQSPTYIDTLHYGGSGFSSSASAAGITGTVTSLSFVEQSLQSGTVTATNNILSVSGLSISLTELYSWNALNGFGTLLSGNDTFIGSAFSDTIMAGAGNDIVNGGAGNDWLYGEAGDDTLIGGAGDDVVNGGLGLDTATYSGLGGVTVDLAIGQSWDKAGSTDFGNDTLTSIENVNGSAGDDWISGTATANTLSGNLGADTIYGLGGDDIIFGGAGNDGLYGGDGNDRIESGAGVDYVEGGLGNDTLIDNSGTTNPHEWSALHGGAGNDIIEGRGRGDVGMWGDEGNDTLTFGAGNSFAYGGSGADVFQFGSDALSLAGAGKSFAQIYDYELGVDHIHVMGGITVLNWGVNTGINVVSASGAHEVIMLMGITSAQLDATSWLI
jgi:Ca2+-binding RTX toxin-like protein